MRRVLAICSRRDAGCSKRGFRCPGGLSLKMRFLLRAWCVQTLFDEWQPAGAPGALRHWSPNGSRNWKRLRDRLSGAADALSAETNARG